MSGTYNQEVRFGSGADYVSLTGAGLQFDVHYEIDALGSETEYGKN